MQDEALHGAITVQSLGSPEWGDARALVDASLGSGYFDSVSQDSGRGIWLGAFVEGRLVGVALAIVTSPRALPVEAGVWARVLPAEAREIGLLKTLVVDAAWRGRGVGRRLTRERLRWLSGKVRDVVTISWTDAGPTAAALLRTCGFQEVAQLATPFARESVLHGVECPTCGDPPCSCSGRLFWRSLV